MTGGAVHHRQEVRPVVPTKEILSVQYLRAVAALSVLAFHLIVRFDGSLPVGASGVDIFFVISGFVMWVTTADKRVTPGEFILKRIVRIVPNYWIATAVTALLILVRPNFMYGHELDPYRFVGSLLFLPTLAGSKLLPVVLQGWTLIYEMMFYILFAVSLFLEQRRRPYLIAGSLCAFAILHASAAEPHIVSVTNPILLEFLAGVLLGIFWKDLTIVRGVAASILVAGAIGLFASECLQPDLPQIVKFGVPAVLLVAGSVFYEKTARVHDVRTLRFLGAASYSIYIWHVVVATMLEGLLLRMHLPLTAHVLLEAAGTVFFACIIYIAVELPITRHLQMHIAGRPLQPAREHMP
jgi:exopolysaccharide production protein ExoZ